MLNEALERLRKQAWKDYLRPWYPGMQMTDSELLVEHIDHLNWQIAQQNKKISDMNWVINPDRMGR